MITFLRKKEATVAAEKLLEKILRGTSDANISFDGLRRVLKHLGFSERIRGSHHIYFREGVEEILNSSPKGTRRSPIRSSRSAML